MAMGSCVAAWLCPDSILLVLQLPARRAHAARADQQRLRVHHRWRSHGIHQWIFQQSGNDVCSQVSSILPLNLYIKI